LVSNFKAGASSAGLRHEASASTQFAADANYRAGTVDSGACRQRAIAPPGHTG